MYLGSKNLSKQVLLNLDFCLFNFLLYLLINFYCNRHCEKLCVNQYCKQDLTRRMMNSGRSVYQRHATHEEIPLWLSTQISVY